jgi:undecaprenyl diphosphate synthase
MFKIKPSDALDQNSKIPNHVAVIMDGNARWAKKRNLPISAGHKAGSQSIQKLIESSIEFGVKYLTIYAFSTENWQRSKEEIDNLMKLMKTYLTKESDKFIKNDVKILISGSLNNLDKDICSKINNLQEETRHNKAITLNVAFDYGGRKEIIDAFKKIISSMGDVKKENFTDSINEELLGQNLYNPEIPDPDLVIRTSGEQRLSNFLLWQSAYSEMYFTDTLWPDFDKNDLLLAILEFQKRQRRYGKR